MNCFRGHIPMSASPHYKLCYVVDTGYIGAMVATCQKQEVQIFGAYSVSVKYRDNSKY